MVFNLPKTSSIGFNWGEYGGRNIGFRPILPTASATSCVLWTRALSIIREYPRNSLENFLIYEATCYVFTLRFTMSQWHILSNVMLRITTILCPFLPDFYFKSLFPLGAYPYYTSMHSLKPVSSMKMTLYSFRI